MAVWLCLGWFAYIYILIYIYICIRQYSKMLTRVLLFIISVLQSIIDLPALKSPSKTFLSGFLACFLLSAVYISYYGILQYIGI